jgi:hypothetical protein
MKDSCIEKKGVQGKSIFLSSPFSNISIIEAEETSRGKIRQAFYTRKNVNKLDGFKKLFACFTNFGQVLVIILR